MQEKSFCLVLSPASALWDQQTLFVIHRQGDTARGCAALWSPLVDEGWTLVVPQWEDKDTAPGELGAHLEECRTKRGLDPARLVMAGVSEGAPLALALASEAGLPWLCVTPVFPSGYDLTPLTAVPQHTRGIFILAEDDPASSRARGVIAALQGAGVSVETRIMAGAGETAAPFAVIASEALKAIPLG